MLIVLLPYKSFHGSSYPAFFNISFKLLTDTITIIIIVINIINIPINIPIHIFFFKDHLLLFFSLSIKFKVSLFSILFLL